MAEEAGYEFCFNSSPRTVVGAIPRGLVGRVSVQPTDWDCEFRLKALGAYGWMSRAGAWKQKIKSWFSGGVRGKGSQAHG
jgi:hypothetical protein